jgi:hypothetical protein
MVKQRAAKSCATAHGRLLAFSPGRTIALSGDGEGLAAQSVMSRAHPSLQSFTNKSQSSVSKGFKRIMKVVGVEAGLGRSRAGAKGRVAR